MLTMFVTLPLVRTAQHRACERGTKSNGARCVEYDGRDLAKATGLHRNTIMSNEVGRYAGNHDSIGLIESGFRRAGVEFFPQNGVRFHQRPDNRYERC